MRHRLSPLKGWPTMSAYGIPATAATRETAAIRRRCTRFLTGHYRRPPQEVLAELAAITDPELENDRYGQEGPITPFEAEIADLLGKEAAVFMPSGTMCQQIALRVILVGDSDQLLTLDDLRKVAEPLAALLLELPQREIGGQLPSWDELVT